MSEHRDLSDGHRAAVIGHAQGMVGALNREGQSLGIAREVMIKAFDEEAERLDNEQ